MRRISELIDEGEIEKLAEQYGPFPRRRYVLRMGREEFDYWREKVARDRRGEVVLVIRRPDGKVILHTKDFYPAGIYRLPSGGVGWGEDVLRAVHREAREETGLEVEVERLLGIIEYEFRCGDTAVPFVSYVFLVRKGEGELAPQGGEHIASFRFVHPEELPAVAAALRNLRGDWRDWGRFRAIAHDLAAEVLVSYRRGR